MFSRWVSASLDESRPHIVLIYKSPNDPKFCASYRSVTLLKNDFNILTKLITIRLQCLLPLIIDSDQMGYMAHRATDINLRRLFTNLRA